MNESNVAPDSPSSKGGSLSAAALLAQRKPAIDLLDMIESGMYGYGATEDVDFLKRATTARAALLAQLTAPIWMADSRPLLAEIASLRAQLDALNGSAKGGPSAGDAPSERDVIRNALIFLLESYMARNGLTKVAAVDQFLAAYPDLTFARAALTQGGATK